MAKNRVLEESGTDPRKSIATELRIRGMKIREIAEIVGAARASVGEWVKGIKMDDGKIFLESISPESSEASDDTSDGL